MKKTNASFLREILKELELSDSIKAAEAIEFLNAIEEEIKEKDDEVSQLKSEISEYEEKENDSPLDNDDFVGLDTIRWSLDHGNLKIQMQMENFINGLKKQNCAGVLL